MNHKSLNCKCDTCGFESGLNEMESHNKEFHLVHQSIKIQNKRKKSVFGCDKCGITVDTQRKLRSHKGSQHPVSVETSSSSEPSPPRKKTVKQVAKVIVEDTEVEMVDIKKVEEKPLVEEDKVTETDQIIKSQERQIKAQAEEIESMKQSIDALHEERDRARKPTNKIPCEIKPIPNHLTPVQSQHLKDLYGIRMKCNGNPGGDCLSSCTTIHLSNTKDRHERKRVNRRINHHIADHFDNFYVNKIPLPYCETVGVGSSAKQITCNTREELLEFLRSEDSLCAFSNYQELLAICNLLNIKIHIFTYGIGGDNTSWSWKSIQPDPEMVRFSDFPAATVPDMLLYNSDNCHFDLLVEDNSRLAVYGLISIEEEDSKSTKKEQVEKEVSKKELCEKEVTVKEVTEKEVSKGSFVQESKVIQEPVSEVNNQWTTVKTSRNSSKAVKIVEKEIVTESDEATLRKHKGTGHKRTGPQSAPLVQGDTDLSLNLEEHMENLSVSESHCDICQDEFESKEELERHVKNKHSKQWNCDTCAFQASSRSILMNHCKLTKGHQPSKQRQRLGQTGVLECYTCKSEFRSYHDLMNHRKEEHPSHKQCRYFVKGECKFSGDECWYVHERSSLISESGEKCFECKVSFPSKYTLMEHKKKDHQSRNKHSSTATKEINLSKTPSEGASPLSSVWQKDFHQPPPAAAPDQTALMIALNMLNQKMDTINSISQRLQALENKMFPKLT